MKTNIINASKFFFALCLAYFAILLLNYHYYLITFPYPIMYREGAMMATTTLLLHGINPYSYMMEPQYTNIYGLVYPLICLPFVKFWGNNLIVYRWVTAFFILASCLMVFLVLNRKKTPLLLNCWALLSLYASLLFPLTTTPSVDPASTGLFLMLLTIFIPYFFNYTYLSLLVSIIFGLLAFYTKPYFVMGLPMLASYLFIYVSKKRALIFGSASFVLFAISAAVMGHFFLSYFDDCLFLHLNYLTDNCMMIVLKRQLSQFLGLNGGIILLMLGMFIYGFWRFFFQNGFKEIRGNMMNVHRSIDWRAWEAPLIKAVMPLEIFAGACYLLLLLLLMGQKFGANLWYFFQLLTPFLLILTASLISRFSLWPIVFSALLIFNLYTLTSEDDYKYFAKDALGTIGWQEIEKLVRSKVYIFNTPLIAPLLIKNDKEVFDDGHTDYFRGGRQRYGLLKFFHSDKQRNLHAFNLFIYKLNRMAKTKKFDLMIFEAGYASDLLPYNNMSNYKYIDSIVVNAPQDRMPYLLTIWSPK